MNARIQSLRVRCRYCTGPLSVHEAVSGQVCGGHACRRAKLLDGVECLEREARDERRRRAGRQTMALGYEREEAHASGTDITVVPASERPLVKLTDSRRRRFARHLIRAAQGLQSMVNSLIQTDAATADAAPGAAPPHTGDEMLASACRVCQGHCCRLGEDHAFIRIETLQRCLAADTTLTSRSLLRRYLSRLPEQSYRGSCIFHGVRGCSLPRQMRSSVCQDYLCGDLRELLALSGNEPIRPKWIAALNQDHLVPARLTRYEPQHEKQARKMTRTAASD